MSGVTHGKVDIVNALNFPVVCNKTPSSISLAKFIREQQPKRAFCQDDNFGYHIDGHAKAQN